MISRTETQERLWKRWPWEQFLSQKNFQSVLGQNWEWETPHHCCGSMIFWGGSGSGSADPCLWLMDPDSDPYPGSGSCCFRHWPSRCQKKTNFLTQFFLLITFWSCIYIIFQRKKVKKSRKIVGIKVFLTIFAWW